MSGNKRLMRSVEHLRVIATPTRVRENEDGTKAQLYRINPMR
jgi:hypothetical protein